VTLTSFVSAVLEFLAKLEVMRRVGDHNRETDVRAAWLHAKDGVFRSPATKRPDVVAKRIAFQEHQPSLNVSSLWFIDECSVSTAINHRYARSKKGQPVVLYAPRHGIRRTLVGAMASEGRSALEVIEKGLRVGSFIAFVPDKLVPLLRPGDVVIQDNLRIHHNEEALELIRATGGSVLFQPPYSPEFNAIEMCWSWLKSRLRRTVCRSIDGLISAVMKRWKTLAPNYAKPGPWPADSTETSMLNHSDRRCSRAFR
jgi:transposase